MRYAHGWHGNWSVTDWTLDEKALLSDGTAVATVATTYTGVPFPVFTGWTIQVPAHQVITQGGQTFTTDYLYSADQFGDYLRPYRVTESSSTTGATRVTERTFDYGFTPYLTGKPASETVTVAGESFATSYAYDHATGFLQSTTQAGVTTTFSPDAAGNTAAITDAGGHQTSIGFQWAVPQTVTAPQSAIVRTLHPDGTVASESRGGATTEFQYDGLGRVTEVIPPEGAATTTNYAADGTSVTVSRDGAWTTTTVDGFGRPIATENAAGVKTVTTYDVEGLKTFQSYPFTSGATGDAFTYDALGRVTSVTHADQSAVHYTYAGTDVAIEDENHHTTTQHWVAFGDPGDGRLAGLTDANGANWVYAYNALGSLTRVQGPEGPDRVWACDKHANHLASDTQPESGTTTYTYTADGLLHTKTDAAGLTTTYTFDGNHRLAQIDAPGTADDAVFSYDARDNRVQATVGGVETVLTYDAANRLTGREDRVQGQVFLTQFAYDSRDNLQTITYPSGRVVSYSYDAASRISQVQTGSQVLADQFDYHASGAVQGFTRGSGMRDTTTFDGRYRPAHLTSGTVLDLTYGYDDVGNVSNVTDTRPGFSAGYTYNPLDRLTGVTGFGATSFTYDAQGNRLTKGTGSSLVTYMYAAATNRLTSATSPLGVPETGTFTYDFVGNLATHTAGADTFTYTYTARNQMATARLNEGPTTSYTYDADGLRTVDRPPPASSITCTGWAGSCWPSMTRQWARRPWRGSTVYLGSKLLASFAPDATPDATARE